MGARPVIAGELFAYDERRVAARGESPRSGRAEADPFVSRAGEGALAGVSLMAGGCVACSSDRDARERSTSGPQIMSSATDTARAAPHTITAVRFHRGAGRCASDHRWLR